MAIHGEGYPKTDMLGTLSAVSTMSVCMLGTLSAVSTMSVCMLGTLMQVSTLSNLGTIMYIVVPMERPLGTSMVNSQ
jgi:hypothetical protein